MRLVFLLKILLAAGCVYLSIRLININTSIDTSISEQLTALTHLKNDPAIDSAENRKRYTIQQMEINNRIDSLRAKRYPDWYRFIAIILAATAGSLIRNIGKTLFRKKPVAQQ